MLEIMNVKINIMNINEVVILFSIIFILRHISNFYGNVVLVNLGKLKFLTFNTILSAFVFTAIIVLFYFINKINILNLLIAMSLSLFYESLSRLLYFKRRKI